MSEDAPSAAPEDSGEQIDETLGSRLRTARESRELSVEKIADELRIEEKVLLALEEDRLSDIKVAPVFIKGYIKQYGRLLELDYDELREAFRRQADAEDVRLQPNRAIYLRDERQITIWIIAGLAVLLVGVALFVWWIGSEDGFSFNPLSDASNADSASVAAPVTSRSVTQRRGESPAVTASVAALEPETPPEQQASDVPAIAQQDETDVPNRIDTSPQIAAVDSDPLAAVVAEPAPIPAEPGSIAMVFEFSQESWFELTDARGRRLYYDLADAGARLSFMALPPARVLIGNASAVSITVDSEARAIPNSSLRGNVAMFVIDPAQD